MAERIVSPGVFTRENDLSFLAQGIGEIGGAFIGPTPKGPAFIPTIVRSQQEYVTRFGEADATHYLGLTAKNYLRESGVATIVRVLGTEGYDSTDYTPALLYVTGSEGKKLFAILHPSQNGVSVSSSVADGSTTSFGIDIDVTGLTANTSASNLSAVDGSTSYIGDFLGYSPVTNKGVYIYGIFPEALAAASSSATMTIETSSTALDFTGAEYSHAFTPYIQSQELGGSNVDLFKLHTLSDGVSANKEIKVSFLNMKSSVDPDYGYGTFSMIIRKYGDTDARQEILEQYDNITLDPDSPQYIARVIGNSAPTEDTVTNEIYYQGEFSNNSQYIFIEMAEGTIPETALPFGFAPYTAPVNLADVNEISAPIYSEQRWKNNSGSFAAYTTASVDNKNYYGWSFLDTIGTNASYLSPVPAGAPTRGNAFNLENLSEVPSGSVGGVISLDDDASFNYRKFTVAFQGGFDGLNPARKIALGADIASTNSQGFNLSTSLSDGSVAYKKALAAISNPDQFDFNLLILPGVIYQLHAFIASEAINLCENRGDAFYIMDGTVLTAPLAIATSKAAEIDSNYVASYYPWLRVIDQATNKLLWVPPSVVLPEVFAYNDNTAAEWFAPAGLNRGGISSAVGVKVRLPQASRDTLYEGKVNPIAQFPGQGICVWGQKTLQRRPSALDRVNVRRLLIAVKKYIASAARYLVFEQNVEATRNRFLNIANPYLASVQERSGLYAFRVIMDDTNNTPDVIDRNILYGQLYLQPTKTAEFIILDFNVLPTGAVFPTA